MSEHAIRPLGAARGDAFVDLAEKHNGVWNGCWCTWFHPACVERCRQRYFRCRRVNWLAARDAARNGWHMSRLDPVGVRRERR